ncbi:MAG: hypothetical protein U0840_26770 [Gemmataceae bacterium]
MSLNTAALDLSNALKGVNEAWEEIRPEWNDPVSQNLETECLEPLRHQTLSLLQALERLSPVLQRALREAE